MDAFKIICLLVFCSYCEGHFISRNYNNRYSQVFPSLNFQTFPEYFKPLYRIKYLTPTSTTKRIQTHTPNPTEITNSKKSIVPSKQRGNGMLSIFKNVKPFKEMMKNPRERVKKPMTGFDTMYEHQRNHALHLKLIPKMIKKEVAKQLGTIFRKMPKDKGTNDKKHEINKTKENKVEVIDITNNKDNTSAKHDKLKEISLDEIKTKTAYINKLEAKSIFGNFIGNKHFANIFIFYPNNDNSAVVVGLKDNMTDVFTKNPVEISTKNPKDHLFDKTTENGIEESLVTKHDDYDLDGNKDHESSNDKSDNTTVSTEVIVTTDNIILTSDATASITTTTENEDKDNKNTDNDEDDLSSNKDNVDEVSNDDSESTKDFSITSTSISTTTELFHTNSDDAIVVNELTENPSEDFTEKPNDKKDEELVVATSTVANEVTESSYENLNDVEHGIKDDEIVDVQGSNEFEDPKKENDVDSTVVPTTVVNQVTETTSENLTEKLNETKDEIVKEDYIHDQVTDESTVVPDDSTVVPDESTVVPDESIVSTDTTSVASTIKDNDITNTEVPSTTESLIEATSVSESESMGPLDNTTETATNDLRETLTTASGESTTESTIENDNSLEVTTDDDYIEIEYTYF